MLGYVAYAGTRHLIDPDFSSIFSGITFGAHELGHLVFAFFGQFLSVAGGTITQVLVPVGAGALLVAHRDYFGLAVAGAWLSISLADIAVYLGDAQERSLTLLGFGPDPEHDWYYLLSTLGLLEQDQELAQLIRLLAALVLGISIALGAQLCLLMRHARRAGKP